MELEGTAANAQPEGTTETPVETPVPFTDSDVPAWRAARLAERTGKPAPAPAAKLDTETPADAAPAQPAEKQVSKRQQQINDYERRIAEQAAEIARLKTPTTPAPAVPAQPQKPAEAAKPQTLQELVTRPDPAQPLLKEAAFFAAHPEAEYGDYTQYVTRHTQAVDRQAEHARSQQTQATQAQKTRWDGFVSTLKESTKADPEFAKKLSADVTGLVPIVHMQPGQPFTVDNAIAEEIIDTGDTAHLVMLHLSQHPDELAKLRATTSARQLSSAIGRLVGRLEREAQGTPETKHVSDAPDPGTTLGRKPVTAADPVMGAVKDQDFSRFQAEKRARLAAQRR